MRHPTSCSGSLTRAEIHPALRPTSFFSDPGREAALHSAHPIPPPPLIELPGLRDPPDVDRLAEPYIRGLKVAGRPKLRPLRTDAPSPGVHEDHHVRDLTRANGCSIPHIVNMLMGSHPEDGTVVDASDASTAHNDSASSMHRSSPTAPPRSPTSPRSCSPNASRNKSPRCSNRPAAPRRHNCKGRSTLSGAAAAYPRRHECGTHSQ